MEQIIREPFYDKCPNCESMRIYLTLLNPSNAPQYRCDDCGKVCRGKSLKELQKA